MFLAACLQMNATADLAKNLACVEAGVARAARYGASLVVTPENTTFLGPAPQKLALAEPLDGPTHRALGALALQHRLHLLVGSVAEYCDGKRCYNTSILFGPDGEIIAFYRKIHLFDIDLPGGPVFRESALIAPGTEVVVAETVLGKIGMSVCYDLRFPALYQRQVAAGAEILSIPSAFTLQTGKDHWHTLLRARAIECQAFVLAPAQEGRHDDQGLRHSYGHSLIIDPWGTLLADCGEGPGLSLAEIDLARVRQVRAAMPVQAHQRL